MPNQQSSSSSNYDLEPGPVDQFDRKLKFKTQQSLEIDTTSYQSQIYGLDIQRIGWEVAIKRSRSHYRLERIKGYDKHGTEKNADESKPVGDLCDIEQKLHFPKEERSCFYSFRSNSRQTHCSFTHFQLRHLLATTSPTDVFYMNDYSIYHWNTITKTTEQSNGKITIERKILDLRKGHGVIKDLSYMGNDQIPGILISTLNASFPYLAVGGFKGEIVITSLENEGEIIYNGRISSASNSITNYMDIRGNTLLVSSNDGVVRKFDLPSMDLLSAVSFEYCINNAAMQSQNGKLMAVIGDTYDVVVCDQEGTKSSMMKLKGHMDYSFALSWNPANEYQFATGSQDRLLCVWDIRRPSSPVYSIPAIIGAVRSVRYSEDGQFLASAEPADFVHIYDVNSNFEKEQLLDFYGEIVGVDFSKKDGGKSLYVGIFDRQFKSLMEFSRFSSETTIDDIFI
ncbi:hypothetical protein FDP41_013590 [Naegleria fowleri]|uniref:Uncharacterized protein n=1 Tax=Naegleria fowleri TaxID=5763 RepID=A0A6A5BYC6_NAEFO|nr:uncharacterized protein FDP41_013590 [Naegleria fowleri]KAF0980376.1 hypothetical protein FDP41_013590 [Naegleria fowleri]